MIDPDEFFEAVREMRSWQRAFFKAPPGSERRRDALENSRRLEKSVDKMIADSENYTLGLEDRDDG